MKAFKLFDKVNGKRRFLYHGLNRSMTVPAGQWLKAEVREVSDGSGGTKYKSGFHVLMTMEDTLEYLEKFTTRKHLKEIVEVEVRNVWPKEHSKYPVFLAEEMKIIGE
jgi:hypothetical protein